MSAAIENIEEEIIEEFSIFEDQFDKFGYLIDLGKSLPAMDPALKTEERLIKGCQANVWVQSEFKDGKVYYQADADADYAKGMVAMMIRVFSGQKPEDIIKAPLEFIKKIGLSEMLSMKRAGGLASMIKQMKLDALVFSSRS